MLRDYQVNDLSQMCRIWNAVVAQGNAFPQLEQLDEQSGDVFFSSQSKTRVCIDEDTVVGLYILHPNNVGRCGHICNASFAVKTARSLGFRILQFNAVVESNASARHLYESLGFHSLGTIPGGFLQSDGAYVNIVPYYISLTE